MTTTNANAIALVRSHKGFFVLSLDSEDREIDSERFDDPGPARVFALQIANKAGLRLIGLRDFDAGR